MDKKDFFTMLGDWQGIKLEPARAERTVQPGGIYELISGTRSGLFNLDVVGYRPLDQPEIGRKKNQSRYRKAMNNSVRVKVPENLPLA